MSIIEKIELQLFIKKWKKRNKQNYTEPGNVFPVEQVVVGKGTYGTLNIKSFQNCSCKLTIGAYCSIATGVVFILGGEHNYKKLMLFPYEVYALGQDPDTKSKGDILIGDDVWIGYGAKILSGVKIGQGAIVAAGSIVHKDIPPYAIYGDGRIIKYRFDELIRKELMKIDYNKISFDYIREHQSLFNKELSLENINDYQMLIGENAKYEIGNGNSEFQRQ